MYIIKTAAFFFGSVVTEKNNSLKMASIGQAIDQAARPRIVIALLQIGLAVQLHQSFAWHFLIVTLHHHGFCSSYHEVQTFNQNVALDQGTDTPSYNGEFVQYAADNVDHNIRTLDLSRHGNGCSRHFWHQAQSYCPAKYCHSERNLSLCGRHNRGRGGEGGEVQGRREKCGGIPSSFFPPPTQVKSHKLEG